MTSNREHWEAVYDGKRSDEMSWYQSDPSVSLKLIQATGVGCDAGVLDVGGGASVLVDRLVGVGFQRLGVLDLSKSALAAARARLGTAANQVEWLEADVLHYHPPTPWDVWHDRAVFHFLVDDADRLQYRASLYRTVPEGGHAIVATFGPDGPERCSGLPTLRCSASQIEDALGEGVRLVEERTEYHTTPSGAVQHFVYARLQRVRTPT